MKDIIISIESLSKKYQSGHLALDNINLEIYKGEIIALLGPNGAGKTTLISVICGLVNATSGRVLVAGHDNVSDYRKARSIIGLVPQELTLGPFDSVFSAVSFSRGLFGKKADKEFINKLLKDLSLLDKKDSLIRHLSGGMKRRVLIAKALSHEPEILFLDEPTAGVDVELRRDMWDIVEKLKERGVTVILTTHYIEEAEAIADRVGVIDSGKIITLDKKENLLEKFGKKRIILSLTDPIEELPKSLDELNFKLSEDSMSLSCDYSYQDSLSINDLLRVIYKSDLSYSEIRTERSSLEDIFVDLVR